MSIKIYVHQNMDVDMMRILMQAIKHNIIDTLIARIMYIHFYFRKNCKSHNTQEC